MKHCDNCNMFFDTDEPRCPVCGKKTRDALKRCDNCNKLLSTDKAKCPVCGKNMRDVPNDNLSTEEIVSSMVITDIL